MSSTHRKSDTSHSSSDTTISNNKDINQTKPSNQLQAPSIGRNRSSSDSKSKTFPSSRPPALTLKRSSTVTGRMTRKRTAEEADSLESDQDPSVIQPDSAGPATGHICLCQPAPKIPRPRNGVYILIISDYC
jgi:hypothetical protein